MRNDGEVTDTHAAAAIEMAETMIQHILVDLANTHDVQITDIDVDTRRYGNFRVTLHTGADPALDGVGVEKEEENRP